MCTLVFSSQSFLPSDWFIANSSLLTKVTFNTAQYFQNWNISILLSKSVTGPALRLIYCRWSAILQRKGGVTGLYPEEGGGGYTQISYVDWTHSLEQTFNINSHRKAPTKVTLTKRENKPWWVSRTFLTAVVSSDLTSQICPVLVCITNNEGLFCS